MANVYIGGWFQRTTLHLSEIFDFLDNAKSPLPLDQQKLRMLHDGLEVKEVFFNSARLDYLELFTIAGLRLRVFEDGLMLMNFDKLDDPVVASRTIKNFYEKKWSPAISYLFSLGAPVPKELAGIVEIYPFFVVMDSAGQEDINKLFKKFKQTKHHEVKKPGFELYRGDNLYVLNRLSQPLSDIEDLIGEQIFIREFKSQLHRYLDLHRWIWEKIAEVKERGKISGKEVGTFKEEVEGYGKTINLIGTRLNQMGAYIDTRGHIARGKPSFSDFVDLLDYKYDTLVDTLDYTKHIWEMTKNYVESAIGLFSAIQAKSTEASVKNLAVITSMGVGATLLGLFTQKPPTFSWFGVGYFVVLAAIGYFTDRFMKYMYGRRLYKIKDIAASKIAER